MDEAPKPSLDTLYDTEYKRIYDEKRREYLKKKAQEQAEKDALDNRNDIEKLIDRITGKR